MTADIAIVLGILLVAMLLFVSERLRPELVALLVLLAVIFSGQVSPEEAFLSLGNPAVITVGAIFVLSAGLFRAGIAHALGEWIASIAGRDHPARLTAVIMVVVGLLSAFMNNVGAAAVLLPVVVGLCRRFKIPPSQMLIPLSFGSLAGGMLTLVGTPANLLVNAMLVDSGAPSLQLFSMTPVGIVLSTLSIGYMVLVGRHLLPSPAASDTLAGHRDEFSDTYNLDERLFRIRIPAGSLLIGRTLAESRLREDWNLNVIAVERRGAEELDPNPETTRLRVGDVLLLEGKLQEFRERDTEPHLEILPDRDYSDADLESSQVGLAEVVVAPRSQYEGKTLREMRFRDHYQLSVVGIWRGNRPVRTNLGDIPLQVGDALLLQGHREQFNLLERDQHFVFIDASPSGRELLRPAKAPFALAALAVMVLAVILGWLELPAAAVTAAVLLVLFGVLSMDEAQQSIELRAVLIIACMLPLGIALQNSGAADYLAHQILNLFGFMGPRGVLAGITLLAALLVQVMSNSTTAVLVTPIALNAAQQLGANPVTFAVGVALAVSAAYLTPISHQSHLLVMGAGGYRFSDYTRVGAGIWLLVLLAINLLVPLFFPLAG